MENGECMLDVMEGNTSVSLLYTQRKGYYIRVVELVRLKELRTKEDKEYVSRYFVLVK